MWLIPRCCCSTVLHLCSTTRAYLRSVASDGGSFGIATRYGLDGPGIESRWGEIFRTRPDRPRGPPSLLYNGYRVTLSGVKRPGSGVDHPPPSSAEVKTVQLYIYSPLGLRGLFQGELYLYSVASDARSRALKSRPAVWLAIQTAVILWKVWMVSRLKRKPPM